MVPILLLWHAVFKNVLVVNGNLFLNV